MSHRPISRLDPKKRYLQVALNSTLEEAKSIIFQLPRSERIIVEAGTPFIKRYGADGIRQIYQWYQSHLSGGSIMPILTGQRFTGQTKIEEIAISLLETSRRKKVISPTIGSIFPYIVADLKTMDRGETEVAMSAEAGASAAIALGHAPTETLNAFIASCEKYGLDSMIDMMNVEFPLSVIRALKKPPLVVILHRGVDEERDNKEKQLPLYEIRRIKGNYNILISIAGGDTIREVQRSVFNDADIVVIWKSVFHNTGDTAEMVSQFLKEIK